MTQRKALWKLTEDAKSAKALTPRKYIKRVSTKRAEELKLYTKLRRAFLKANPQCHVFCRFKSSEIHHKYGRVGKLLNWTEGWIAVSRTAHHLIQDHPEEARKRGWICKKGLWNNQALVKNAPHVLPTTKTL